MHRSPSGSCKSHNVKNWMIGCADRGCGALHFKKRTREKLTYWPVLNVLYEGSAFVQLKRV